MAKQHEGENTLFVMFPVLPGSVETLVTRGGKNKATFDCLFYR